MFGASINKYVQDNKLRVRVIPKSSKSQVMGFDSERNSVLIKLKCPPEDGKANAELIKLISKELGRKATIIKGLTGRDKVLLLE